MNSLLASTSLMIKHQLLFPSFLGKKLKDKVVLKYVSFEGGDRRNKRNCFEGEKTGFACSQLHKGLERCKTYRNVEECTEM